VTSPLEQTLIEIARAVRDGDELEMPRLQAYANGLRLKPDDSSLLSRAIELLDEMAARRLVRMRLFERLPQQRVFDDTDLDLAIADLADEAGSDPPPSAPPSSAHVPGRRGRPT
jgi:hypothetical protein